MITVPAAPDLHLDPRWEAVPVRRGRHMSHLRVTGHGTGIDVRVERCAAGRLRHTYPAGARDMEVRVDGPCPRETLAALLRSLADAVDAADPSCRRIVFAAASGDRGSVTAAQSAGFRYVTDVDLGREELSLLVAEPAWVTRTDIDLDRVPGS
ncbi:hypothetical protein [Streptomyces sp. GC420]|uniref:hypothetical protein n=1 Tax=Streptomyces sp. GC420 TaxID=2697568 RepID=UPI001414CDFB|nr:hypothetical protein [Streptomyces sp. GC420]NBM20910.1 hypothetical protein [Streptomyces sp. GC420]